MVAGREPAAEEAAPAREVVLPEAPREPGRPPVARVPLSALAREAGA